MIEIIELFQNYHGELMALYEIESKIDGGPCAYQIAIGFLDDETNSDQGTLAALLTD